MDPADAQESLRERNKRRIRDRILDETATLLATRALEDVSVDEIAACAEVSRATVFNYFPGKKDIVMGIADREISALVVRAREENRRGTDPLQMIGDLMLQLAEVSFGAGSAGWQILRALLEDPEDHDSPVWRFLSLLEDAIRSAVRAGRIRSNIAVDECARAMFGTFVAEMFAAAGSGKSVLPQRRDFDRIAAMLLSGFAVQRTRDMET